MLIHIGYPKSGSTSLQEFFEASKFFNLVASRTLNDKNVNDFIKYLTQCDSINYDSRYASSLYHKANENCSSSVNKIDVISEEIFTAGGICYSDRGLMAHRLKDLFDDAKILVIIRNQFSIIKSRYMHNPTNINALPSFDKPLTFQDWFHQSALESERSYLGTYDYSKLVKYYQNIFGTKNVYVGLFEELVTNPNQFFHDLLNY